MLIACDSLLLVPKSRRIVVEATAICAPREIDRVPDLREHFRSGLVAAAKEYLSNPNRSQLRIALEASSPGTLEKLDVKSVRERSPDPRLVSQLAGGRAATLLRTAHGRRAPLKQFHVVGAARTIRTSLTTGSNLLIDVLAPEDNVAPCPSCGQRVFEIEGQLVEHDDADGNPCK